MSGRTSGLTFFDDCHILTFKRTEFPLVNFLEVKNDD